MIRITKSASRKPAEYLMLAEVLMKGMNSICTNDCNTCRYKTICKSVSSAAMYATKLSQENLH